MLFKKVFIILILLSADFFSADSFLYAQNSKNPILNNATKLIHTNKADASFVLLNRLLKDTVNLNTETKAELYYQLTKYYAVKNKEAIELFYNKKAELLYRQLNNDERLCDLLYAKFDLMINQTNLSNKKDAKIYLDEFYKLALKKNKKQNLIKAYKGFARLKYNSNEYKEALIYYDKALLESKLIDDSLSVGDILSNKGLLISYYSQKQDSARLFYFKSIKLYKLIKSKDKEFSTSINVGFSYLKENKLKQALLWFQKADSIPLNKYKNNKKKILYGNMSNTYEQLKDYKNALDYVWLYNDYKDSVDIKAQNIAISDINIKYKTLEKEKKNLELEESNKRKQLYIIGITGTLIALVIFSYLGFRNIKKKKEIAEKNTAIQKQKVVTLVKDQELMSIDAMIEGQEIERKKIAEDLHDNLGSTLATLKLHFDNYRSNLSVNNTKQLGMLNSTENILNEAYNKVRTMAHANQASVLADHSLVEAAKSLAHNISLANKTQIEVMTFGFDKPLNHTTEITLFRIIQELITNIIKHANAKTALIDLNLFDDSLGLIVEDNGVGFDIAVLNKEIKGMGLNSIKDRIKKMNGTFEIDTKIGNGTTILIDIPINNNEF